MKDVTGREIQVGDTVVHIGFPTGRLNVKEVRWVEETYCVLVWDTLKGKHQSVAGKAEAIAIIGTVGS